MPAMGIIVPTDGDTYDPTITSIPSDDETAGFKTIKVSGTPATGGGVLVNISFVIPGASIGYKPNPLPQDRGFMEFGSGNGLITFFDYSINAVRMPELVDQTKRKLVIDFDIVGKIGGAGKVAMRARPKSTPKKKK